MERQRFSLIFLFISIFIGSTHTNGQITLQAGAGLGAVVPAGDLRGSTIDYYSGTRYGLSTGFSVHGRGRLGFGGFTLMGEAGYSSLTNSGDAESGQGKVEVSQKIISFKIGPEYHIDLPAIPLKPYLGANLGLNIFSGETTFQGVSRVPSGTFTAQTATRAGVGFGAGIIFTVGPLTYLDISMQYNALNMFGKKWEDIDIQDRRLDSYLALNDKEDPLYAPNNNDHFIKSSRAIHTIALTASLMFGL